MIYLLDTDTIIYWMKGSKKVSGKVLAEGYNSIASSDITRAELYYGAYKSQKVTENLSSIKKLSEKINFLPFNEPAQVLFGDIKAKLEEQGNRLDDFDIMIASTALASNLILITNNTIHMERIPKLKIENWSE